MQRWFQHDQDYQDQDHSWNVLPKWSKRIKFI
jgi:hypothetical protein